MADAIEDHYRPRSQDDEIPEAMVSVAVSVAEKLDNIFANFSVGNIPKGSADPYALRRQANAVVEMIIKNEINIPLRGLLLQILGKYRNGEKLVDQIMQFMSARARTIFTESGLRYDEIDACLSIGNSDFTELYRGGRSISDFRKDDKFSNMLLSFKRMNNILSGFKKENAGYMLSFDEKFF